MVLYWDESEVAKFSFSSNVGSRDWSPRWLKVAEASEFE